MPDEEGAGANYSTLSIGRDIQTPMTAGSITRTYTHRNCSSNTISTPLRLDGPMYKDSGNIRQILIPLFLIPLFQTTSNMTTPQSLSPNYDYPTPSCLAHRAAEHASMIAQAADLFGINVSETLEHFGRTSPSRGHSPVPPQDPAPPRIRATLSNPIPIPIPPPNEDLPMLPDSQSPPYVPQTPEGSPLPLYTRNLSPPPTNEEEESTAEGLTTPTPDEPHPGVHPGVGWCVNNRHLDVLLDNGRGGLEIAPFIQYDLDDSDPEVLGTRGRGCVVRAFPLHARPDPFPRRVFTRKEEFSFWENETFTPLVDTAIAAEADVTLHAEVIHYRASVRREQRLADRLSQLRNEFIETRADTRASARRLSQANAHYRVERQIHSNQLSFPDMPRSVLNAHIDDFLDPWNDSPRAPEDPCTWCQQSRHNASQCAFLTRCQLCGSLGHLEASCYKPHTKCRPGRICRAPRDHLKIHTSCRATTRTFSA
jgi:hypothetical protein